LEAVFTVALAAAFYREPIGRRVILACSLVLVGGGVLALRVTGGTSSALGLLSLVAATVCWALDNTLTRPLSDFDPRAVVFWKATLGASLSALAAMLFRQAPPPLLASIGLLVCGACGYGFSLRLYLQAQRTLGAARTGSLFALAPFLGALVAFAFGDRSGAGYIAVATALFSLAAYLHVTEDHHHRHRHDALEHEHAHSHDDGHHMHHHEALVTGTHTHSHRHDALEHDHSHGSDVHHRHKHD
jgi:drug/metabolite transporter (DMT)-like permease